MTFREWGLSVWGAMHIGEVGRRRALRRVLRYTMRQGACVLDAGCGRGDNAYACAIRYPTAHVDAIDVDPSCVAVARAQYGQRENFRNLTIFVGDIGTYQHSQGERYAIIYSVDVFEHLPDPHRAIQNLVRALLPNGVLILHVPRAQQRRWFRRFEYYEQHDHERDGYEPEDLRTLGESAGLQMVETRHTFGPPGALAWELWHLAQGVGKWCAVLTYPIPWTLAWIDARVAWKRGNGLLVIYTRKY